MKLFYLQALMLRVVIMIFRPPSQATDAMENSGLFQRFDFFFLLCLKHLFEYQVFFFMYPKIQPTVIEMEVRSRELPHLTRGLLPSPEGWGPSPLS